MIVSHFSEFYGQGDGSFIDPTIFADVNDEMKVPKEEIFGPILAAMPFKDLDEVIRLENNSEYFMDTGCEEFHYVTNQLKADSMDKQLNCFDTASPFEVINKVGSDGKWEAMH